MTEQAMAEDFVAEAHIPELLAAPAPDHRRVQELLAKAETLAGLTLAEAAALLAADEGWLPEMLQAAGRVKDKVYGPRAVLYVPLYFSNVCQNNCKYCGFRRDNTLEHRRTLSYDEIYAEARALVEQGYTIALVLTGEHPQIATLEYLMEGIRRVQQAGIKRVDVEVPPLDVSSFAALKDLGVGTVTLFQETYHRPTYRDMHPSGPKANYDWRLHTMTRAMTAGLYDVDLGALLGLYDYKFETLGLIAHGQFLQRNFGMPPRCICIPRLRPARGALLQQAPYPLSDADLKRLVAVVKLALPFTGITLSTRERPALRDELLSYGVVQISAGSSTSPGGYVNRRRSDEQQFPVEDPRSLSEVVAAIVQQGYLPSFCTDCHAAGRSGAAFLALARTGKMRDICTANAYQTYQAYQRRQREAVSHAG